ncbi:alkaline-phosphatase-like protein [Obelidium mucronatum]|nr:alkaline-phosphatase-like protein [Obelidium mucronatum]
MFIQTNKSSYFMYGLCHFPGLFFLDAVVANFLIVARTRRRRSLAIFLLMPLQTLIASTTFGYFVKTKNYLDWFVFEDLNWDRMQSYAQVFKHELMLVAVIFSTLLALKFYGAYQLHTRSLLHHQYLPVKVEESPPPSYFATADLSNNFKPKQTIRKRMFLIWCTCQFAFSYFLVIKKGTEMARLSENFLISPPLTFAFRAVRNWNKQAHHHQVPHTQDENSGQDRFMYQGPKLDNVVILFMESMRADVFDFGPDSYLSQILLDPEHVQNFDSHVAPFINALKKRSLQVGNTRTTAAYTLKSLMATLCSVYALKGPHEEYRKTIYAPCLPQILTNHSTAFMQPATMSFDHQGDLFQNLGFDKLYTVDDTNIPESQWLNLVGLDDREILPEMMQFVDASVTKQQPYLLTFIGNSNHHPFNLPPGFPKKAYTSDQVINDYFDAINNVDDFVKSFFAEFEKRKLLESTLFVIVGDHGINMGDHGVVGTAEGPFDESFRVPLLFYSENKYFQENLVGRYDAAVPTASIDILPTILDFLHVPYDPATAAHEGQSLLRTISPDRPLYMTSNPWSQHSQIYIQNGMKLRLDVRSGDTKLYNLTADPKERHEITESELTDSQRQWAFGAYESMMMISDAVDLKFRNRAEV